MDIKAILKPLMPVITIAASMGGPFGVAAAKALENKLNEGKPTDQQVSIAPTIDGIHQALSNCNDPDVLLKAQQADQAFAETMSSQGLDLERIAAADRADARLMARSSDKNTPRILALIVIAGWIAVQFYIMPQAMHATHAPDPSMIGLVNRLMGTLDGALMLVLAFYFGSSSGSEHKTELISQGAKP